MVNTSAEAFAPATVANLGAGFDILGLALCEPGDIVRAERRPEPGAVIVHIDGDQGLLPRDPQKNTACVAANETLRLLGVSEGVALTLHKGLPLASGLGSSAASAVAAAVAVNALHDQRLSLAELMPACLAGEAAVSGWHADNVAPCLLGGIQLVAGLSLDTIRRLPTPASLFLALVTPEVSVPTAMARAVLPQTVSLRDMVSQTAAVARLIDALYRGDLAALGAAMEQDSVIEPARCHLMPLLSEVRTAARAAGALGLVISGAGPTLCAVCDSDEQARRVAQAMGAVYDAAGVGSVVHVSPVAERGAQVLNIQ